MFFGDSLGFLTACQKNTVESKTLQTLHIAFFQRKKARKILPLSFLHKTFINSFEEKMQF